MLTMTCPSGEWHIKMPICATKGESHWGQIGRWLLHPDTQNTAIGAIGSFVGVSTTGQRLNGLPEVEYVLNEPSPLGSIRGIPKSAVASFIKPLQGKFESLAESQLIPKYRKLDPDLKWGYTGSFKTGEVGNSNKPTFGSPINLLKFDVDVWIESDLLFKTMGRSNPRNLRAVCRISETAVRDSRI